MKTLFVGLDLGSSSFHQVAMQADGTIVLSRRFPMSEASLLTAFDNLGMDIHVHLEAGELAAWVRTIIAPLVTRVVISHPRTNLWIARDPRKCDERDAVKLADLLRMNRFQEVYISELQARRDFKLLVQHCDDLTAQQTRLKNKIKSRLRVNGVIIKNHRLYTQAGRENVLSQLGSQDIREAVTQLYELLDQTHHTLRAAQRLMFKAAQSFPEIELFTAVPGIGPIGACRFSAYVQTPHRFSSVRKLWRYCQLGISQRTSDGKPLGRSKLDWNGNGKLKDVTYKAFKAALRTKGDNTFKRAYERSLATTHNHIHARLNVQRKFVSVLRAMWMTHTPYRDEAG